MLINIFINPRIFSCLLATDYRGYFHIVLFIVLIVLSFFLIRPFLMALLFGALLAYLLYPLYNKLQGKIKNKTAGALILCIFALILIVVPGFFLIKTLVQQSFVLFLSVKQRLSIGLFRNCDNAFCGFVKSVATNPNVTYQVQEILKSVTNGIIKKGSDFLLSVPKILLNLFVMFFTLFYLLKEGKDIVDYVGKYMTSHKQRYVRILTRLKEITHGVLYGYLLVAIIQGALGAIGFFIFGISSPLFWGMVMALLALVPLVGTSLVWVPASIIVVLDGVFQDSNWIIFKGVGLFLYGLIIISALDNLIRPKLMGHTAKVHPAIVLLGTFGGLVLLGPSGVIVGPLILSLTFVFVEAYLKRE